MEHVGLVCCHSTALAIEACRVGVPVATFFQQIIFLGKKTQIVQVNSDCNPTGVNKLRISFGWAMVSQSTPLIWTSCEDSLEL